MEEISVFEWVNNLSRYIISETALRAMVQDRGVMNADCVPYSTLTEKQKDLIQADVIFNAVMFSPSSTGGSTLQHNGYQQTIGAQTDLYQKQKIAWAKSIYKLYNDPKYDMLNEIEESIKIYSLL